MRTFISWKLFAQKYDSEFRKYLHKSSIQDSEKKYLHKKRNICTRLWFRIQKTFAQEFNSEFRKYLHKNTIQDSEAKGNLSKFRKSRENVFATALHKSKKATNTYFEITCVCLKNGLYTHFRIKQLDFYFFIQPSLSSEDKLRYSVEVKIMFCHYLRTPALTSSFALFGWSG